MSDITPQRRMIQNEETRYQAAVSESTMTRVGAGINFINERQNKQFFFGVGGSAQFLPLPFADFGMQEVFEFMSEITNVGIRYGNSGTSGTTELDIEWAADGSSTWASIFSTTPKVTSAAPNDGVFDSGGVSTTPSGVTVPVLSKTTFDPGDKLRCNIVTSASGMIDFYINIAFRPTSI